MRRLAVVVAAVALVACAEANHPGDVDGDPVSKVDGRPRADAPPHVDATPIPDAAPGTPDATPTPDAGPAAAPDTCAMAYDLTAAAMQPGGTTITGDNTGYANDTQPSSTCTGYIPDGPDAIYTVTVSAGHTITATVTPVAWDASIFISSNCVFAAACLIGADDSPLPGGYETVQLAVPSTGTYYVVVESWDPGDYGPYTLDLQVQ